MNNTFNIQRFGLLLKRQWLEFGKIYLVNLFVAFGVIIAFYGFQLWPFLITKINLKLDYRLDFREPLFIIFGFIFISIIASNYFSHLGQKPKAIIDLLIPASTFEKFLTGIFFTSILAVVSFIFLFYITDFLFVIKLREVYTDDLTNLRYFFSKSDNLFKPIYITPFFITSVFLLGSIYFNKYHYIKTAICVMIFTGLASAIIVKSAQLLFEGKILINNENRGFYNISSSTAEWLGVLLLVILTIIFWFITYIRLKEKQV